MRRGLCALGAAAGIVMFSCVGTRPPLPESAAEIFGQDAARQFTAGDFDGALRLYLKALGEARRIDNPALRARYQFNIGRVLYEGALFDSALVRFDESARLFAVSGNTEDAAVAGIYVALTFAYKGLPDTAASLLARNAAPAGAVNEGIVSTARAIISLRQGNNVTARRSADRAMELARERKDPFVRGGIFFYQAMIAFTDRDAATARRQLDSSLYCYAQSPYRYRNWKTLLGRAIVEYCSGDSLTGSRYYRRAKMAAPSIVAFPEPAMVSSCPESW